MQKLITASIAKKLPFLGATENDPDPIVHLKLFCPWSNWTWYITEYDPEKDIAFGLVNGLEEELGYISIKELREIRGPGGLRIERDIMWSPTPLKHCRKK